MAALKREYKKSKKTFGSSRHWPIKTKSGKIEKMRLIQLAGKKLSHFGRRLFNTLHK